MTAEELAAFGVESELDAVAHETLAIDDRDKILDRLQTDAEFARHFAVRPSQCNAADNIAFARCQRDLWHVRGNVARVMTRSRHCATIAERFPRSTNF